MKQSNILRWLLLSACLVLVVPASAMPSGEAARYYEDALQQFNAQQYKSAAIQLKNALQQDPSHLPARVLLARVHLEQGDSAAAEKEIRLAAELGADPGLTVLPLAEALTNQRKFEELVQEINIQGVPPSIARKVLVQRGDAYMELGNHTLAQDEYRRALDSDPAAAEPKLGLAMVALRQGRLDEALGLVEEVLAAHPGDADAWHAKGTVAYARGQRDQAIADYERALATQPDHYGARLARATALMDLRRFAEALPDLRALVDGSRWDPKASYLLAVALDHTGDAAGARKAIQQAAELVNGVSDDVLGRHAPTLLLAGLINFSAGELEKAYRHLSTYLERDNGNVEARKLLGATLIAMKEPAKAIPVLQVAVNLAPDNAAVQQLLGEAYLYAGQHDLAILTFQDVERLAPGSGELLAKLGVARLMADDRTAAIRDMEAAIAKRPDAVNVAATLAAAHMGQGNYPRAAEIAADLVAQQPDNLTFINLLAAAQANSGDLAAARMGYERILQLNPEFRPAQINLAHLDLREGRGEQAAARLNTLLQADPENTRLLFELAKIEQGRGNTEDAIRLLEKAHQLNPRAKFPALRLIDLLIAERRAVPAVAVARPLLTRYPDDPQVLEAAGKAYLAADDRDNALQAFRQMSNQAGYDAAQLKRAASWLLRSNAVDDARWALQKAVEGDPEDIQALASLADLQLRTDRLDQATELIAQLRKLAPEHPAGLLLEGDLALRQGDAELAERAYRDAATRRDTDDTAIRIFRAVMQQGDTARAVEGLASWVASHPQAYAARLALAEAQHGSGDLRAAQQHYEALLSRGPASPALLNNLANLYLAVGDERALQMARRAYQAAPQVAEVIDTLGWALVKTGDPQQGLSYLRDAVARNASSPEIRLHLGVALQQLGRNAEAREQFREVLAAPGDSPWKQEAQRYLDVL
jgi:putative PEP-CTERM system TPR-repeat lipoprotein